MATDERDVEQKLDENLLAVLPEGGKVVSVTPSGMSDYCNTYRVEVSMPDGSSQVFFQKESAGETGWDLMEAAYKSEITAHEFIPEFLPRPITLGTYKSRPNVHFYLAEFAEMIDDDIPGPEGYMSGLIALHTRSMGKSPNGMFGFPINTRFGNMEQENGWKATWEEFWSEQMRRYLDKEEAGRGPPDAELARLRPLFFEKVIPRYLRPLETGGRSITPALVHGDAWPGNIKYRTDGETVCAFDTCIFWAHNEMDLGVIRNPRYPLGKPYLKEYWKHVPISEPEEDADSRNSLYLLRNQVLLAALYPQDHKLREIFVSNMRFLVDRVQAEEDAAKKVSQLADSLQTQARL
ncbi:Fructosamine kinase-domain-containing protein [Lasiosphaeria ovina]|uniref:protein-ribulosamine 3-kinase n=1 Tax=Lasiosphaeria ovina TaxID=92902 RepID=A0AAE0K7N9_9PEZI|nr:Fructosamine kinase-domain-containing protein [Lasiosphaeria ovina]